MTRTRTSSSTTILAFLGSVALGFTAMIHAVIAAVALFSGNLIGAVGEASAKSDLELAAGADHAAFVAKLLAIAFVLFAALEFGAGEFLRRRIRTTLVPLAGIATVVGEGALGVWSSRFTALEAIVIGCAAFATWTWWRLPRPDATLAIDAGLELT